MVENERKFLVKEMPNLAGVKFHEIEQGYISFTPEVRIRKKGLEYFLTNKGEGDQIRSEIESRIDKESYANLMLLVQGNVIRKTRYEIELDFGVVAELDIYHGYLEGLVVVETEFKSEEQLKRFVVPTWFGKEVTADKRYKNKWLARLKDVKEILEK